MKTSIFILFVSFLSLLSSCGGDGEVIVPPTASSKKQLISKAWRLISEKIEGVEQFVNVPVCSADDLIIINENGTFQDTNGATKCNPNDPQVLRSANWLFHENETKFQFLTDDAPIFTILELSATTLKTRAIIDNEQTELTFVAN